MIELRLLGPLELRAPDDDPARSILTQPRQLAMLASLMAGAAAAFHRRDSLLVRFWPKADEKHARNSLSASLTKLRHALGEKAIVTRGAHEIRVDRAQLWCDVVALEESFAAGHPEDVIGLYRGPFLEGFVVTGLPECMEWVERERARLRRLAEDALHLLAEIPYAVGDLRPALALGYRLAAEEPYHARTARALMRLLAAAGDLAAALHHARSFQERMAKEFAAEPDPKVAALAEQLRVGSERNSDPDQRKGLNCPARPS